MRKAVLLALAITMMLLLAGCGSTSPSPGTNTPEPASNQQVSPSVEPTPPQGSQSPLSIPPTPSSPVAPSFPPPTSPSTVNPTQSPTPVIPRGSPDAAVEVTVNLPEKAWAGTTIFADNHDLSHPRIIEVNILGEVVWEYVVPSELKEFTNPGFDVEPLANGNILFVLPRNGVYEIDRTGNVVWKYPNADVSHDADRLPNGNTLIAFGAFDQFDDAQVKEVNPQGQIVWSWHARDYFNSAPYKDIFQEGWTHTNAVSRLQNGNTIISLRNFNFVVEVDTDGKPIRRIGEGVLRAQHDPEVLPNGDILMADHNNPQRAIELDPKTGRVIWEFVMPRQLVRDANRLPNGNTLITGSTSIIEVTQEKQVVWQLRLKGIILEQTQAPSQGFYKAERISAR